MSEEVEKMEGAYDYDAVVSVQWAFGYGLSYTSFSYSNLKVNKANFTADDELIFTVDVKKYRKPCRQRKCSPFQQCPHSFNDPRQPSPASSQSVVYIASLPFTTFPI